jgi:outer membrane lipoprotein-sorting protein
MLTKSNVSGFTLVPVLFVLTLFLLLSALSVSVILAGSTVYEKIADNMDDNYDRRVSFSYLATKIRQNDSSGSIYVANVMYDKDRNGYVEREDGAEDKDDIKMIALKESYDGGEEVTYIYYHNGYIRELYLTIESDGKTVVFELDWGDEIIQVEGFEFDFKEDENAITMTLTDRDGNKQSTMLFLRSQG